MTKEKPQPAPSSRRFAIHSVTLSAEESAILNQLSRDATDFLGRSISGSAILRALLRQIDKQGPGEADALFIEVEKELKAGVRWGKQR